MRFNQFIEFLTREQKVSLSKNKSFIEKTNKDFMNFFVYFTDPQHKKALKIKCNERIVLRRTENQSRGANSNGTSEGSWCQKLDFYGLQLVFNFPWILFMMKVILQLVWVAIEQLWR